MAATAADVTGVGIAKRLASCDKAARERALRALEAWLPSSAVSDEELLKIWKGLFYCVWHADKAPVQVALARRLAALLPSLPPPLAPRFLASFLSTIRREWSGIDHLRLDKYYVLIRAMLHQCFASLQAAAWDSPVVAAAVDVLSARTLLAVDKYPAEGVNYHIAQVFLDEILEFLPLGRGALESLLKPFFAVLETSPNRTLVAKVKACVFERFLDNGHKFLAAVNAGGDVDSEAEKLGRIALAFGFSKRFLSLASAAATIQSNRKILFLLHERFSKLEKACVGKSGLDVLPPVPSGDPGDVSASSFDHAPAQYSDVAAPDCKKQSEVDATANGSSNSEGTSSKKRKKCKKESRTGKKKKHAKSEDAGGSASIANESKEIEPAAGNGCLASDEGVTEDTMENGDSITFSETLMSNLQKQFEKVAAEDGMVTPAVSAKIKKRKRVKSADGKASYSSKSLDSCRWKKSSRSPKSGEDDGIATGKSAEKSVKRVRFSMKSNLVWKPHSPLPPQSLRLPPSATPRGSALKKGVPPGPIKETPPSKKVKVKAKASSIKKTRKIIKSASPSTKRLKKLQSTI